MISSIAIPVFALTILLLVAPLESVPIDNAVIGLPAVTCGDDQVTMVFSTQRPFTGRIFVKGMSDKNECATAYRTNTESNVTFQLKGGGNCNMRRQRRLGPQRGVETSMTVIISFHDTFITKVDRAYRCTCFFAEASKVVTSQFEVSQLPTTDIFDTARMPVCTYAVRRGSLNGPVVNYARVGESVYHVWSCDGAMFGMLVHSCFVDDGEGQNKFQLNDQVGCAIDPIILGELNYNSLLNQAYVEAQVFKFADKVSVYFQCAISMCLKNDGACAGVTPPHCNRTRARFRREPPRGAANLHDAISNSLSLALVPRSEDSIDVASDKIIVLDVDENLPPSASDIASAAFSQNHSGATLNSQPVGPTIQPSGAKNEICLTVQGFGLLLAIFGLVTSTALIATTIACLRYSSLTRPGLK